MNNKRFLVLSLTALFGAAACVAAAQHPQQAPASPAGDRNMPDMPGMKMGPGAAQPSHTESDAMQAMQSMHHAMDMAHMRMTPAEPATPQDLERADQIVSELRPAIEKYKDYRVALADGYRIFMPNLPQPMYHFTNAWNGFLEAISFDPARPTSLLYTKTADGYELIGAMYTAPKTATLEQLNQRVPLGVARWHAHTNLCMPRQGEVAGADWKKFGLAGSISTPEACAEAGGRFFPQIFGWMVHVYPFETEKQKVWAH